MHESSHRCHVSWIRYQLAFALLVAEQLPGLMGPVEAYDPVFNDIDRALLHSVGVKVHVCVALHPLLWCKSCIMALL